ncbi:flagellar biosynthesis/type III secretory pathway protein FliH [Povalibacter uvarum]|uniref:Flagellar assembly protein FliH n=1 Tax=Povalibacter uvarum TaxID=732238 RepID=A0A841HEQ2_9GAMM|nr:FliH/SctL family protein [Povalibacter uvarum]MBB6091173.1 flagellar biosynthesis/type III secretory pathway protein FliH [Povalibacter uvarum]
MGALIRPGRIGARRVRLSEARSAHAAAASQPGEPAPSPEASLRVEIDAQVRAEIAAHAESVYEAERERGRSDGHAEALNNARAQAAEELTSARAELTERVSSALAAIERAHGLALASLESAVGELTWIAVCRVAGRSALMPAFVLGVARQVCAELRGESSATARLHSRDVATLRDLIGELSSDPELRIGELRLTIEPDDALDLGGCVIKARSGEYDGSLEGQLRRLHAVLVASGATQ